VVCGQDHVQNTQNQSNFSQLYEQSLLKIDINMYVQHASSDFRDQA